MNANRRRRVFWWVYAALYDQLWDNAHLAVVGGEIRALLPAAASVLEIGAGTGIVTQQLVNHGYTVVACEPNGAMAERLARRLPDTPLARQRLEDLATAVGDNIVAVNVLHMLDDPLDGLRHLRRLCCPGGMVIVVSAEPHTTMFAVAAAHRSAGVPLPVVARFIAWHFLLAPLTVLSRMSARGQLAWIDSADVSTGISRRVADFYRLLTLPALDN